MDARAGFQSLQWISREYFDLNGTHCETLDEPPTPLQFLRIAHISRPVIIRNFNVPALEHWTNEYLSEKMGDRTMSVAVTPDGRADSITRGNDGKFYFVEPHIQQMTMKGLLTSLSSNNHTEKTEIYYLQSQNGNIYSSQFFKDDSRDGDRSEFGPLRPDVPSEIPWCSEAFERTPDAVNIWIGDSRSVTSVHSGNVFMFVGDRTFMGPIDPYENIYTVIRGTKQFTLLPPTEGWCLNDFSERTYSHATYTRSASTSTLSLNPSHPSTPPIRWSSIADPSLPKALSPEAHPIHITLHAGETLYLPAGWWHHVRQIGEVTIALNWWYDIESRGMAWVWLNFLRGIGGMPPAGQDEEIDDLA